MFKLKKQESSTFTSTDSLHQVGQKTAHDVFDTKQEEDEEETLQWKPLVTLPLDVKNKSEVDQLSQFSESRLSSEGNMITVNFDLKSNINKRSFTTAYLTPASGL